MGTIRKTVKLPPPGHKKVVKTGPVTWTITRKRGR